MSLQVLIICWICIVAWQIWRDYPRWKLSCILGVKDGDTITYYLEGESNAVQVGRLWRIDAFELSQKPWGSASNQRLSQYLKYDKQLHDNHECQKIYVKFIKKDFYQRNLILIKKHSIDHQSINEKLIASGWALIYPASDWGVNEKAKWQRQQDFAKIQKKGIWKYPRKYWQTPWQYRKQNKDSLRRNT